MYLDSALWTALAGCSRIVFFTWCVPCRRAASPTNSVWCAPSVPTFSCSTSQILPWTKPCTPPSAARPARFTGPGRLGGFCFASLPRALSSFSPRFSIRSLDSAACSCRLLCRNLDFGTLCPEVPLLVFSLMGHILRAGRQQIVNLTTREAVNKRDSHIPIEQQAIARVGVGDVGKLVL